MRVVAALLALIASSVPASADRLMTSGYEANNSTSTEWTAVVSATIVTTAPHSGTYHGRGIPNATAAYFERNLSANKTTGSLYYRVMLRIPASSVELNDWPVLRNASSTGVAGFEVRIDLDRTVDFVNTVPATDTVRQGSVALSTGTWYRFEVTHTLSDTAGSMDLKIYQGTTSTLVEDFTDITSEDTLPTNIFALIRVGNLNGCGDCDVYIDDIAINDELTTSQTGVPPAAKVAFLEPGSDSTVTWTKTGANCSGTTNTDCVDDLPGAPDDASGYNTSSVANNEDRLNVGTLPAAVPSDADMVYIHVLGRFGGGGTTGTRTGRLLLWDEGGAQTNGDTTSDCDVAAGTWGLLLNAEDLVLDLGARTKANVESFDLGYEPLNANECRVTAVWANVEWIEAPPAASCASYISLLGAGCR